MSTVKISFWKRKSLWLFIVLIFVLGGGTRLIGVYYDFYRTEFLHHQIYQKIAPLTDENRLLQYRFNKPLLSKTATWHCHIDMYELPKDINTSKLNEIASRYDNEKQTYPSRCFDTPIWGLQKPPYKEKWLFFNLKYVGNESGHKHWDILVKGDTKNAPLSRSVSDEIWQIDDDKRQFVMIDKNTNTVRVIESYWDCDISVLLCN